MTDYAALLVRLRNDGILNSNSADAADAIEQQERENAALRRALEAVDAHWASIFAFGPDEPDAHKAMRPAALIAWRIARAALERRGRIDGHH